MIQLAPSLSASPTARSTSETAPPSPERGPSPLPVAPTARARPAAPLEVFSWAMNPGRTCGTSASELTRAEGLFLGPACGSPRTRLPRKGSPRKGHRAASHGAADAAKRREEADETAPPLSVGGVPFEGTVDGTRRAMHPAHTHRARAHTRTVGQIASRTPPTRQPEHCMTFCSHDHGGFTSPGP
jgi:hypothetical protein